MSHSLTKIWIHLIFGTKERFPHINQSFEKQLYDHIRNLLEKDFDCIVDIINGTADHIQISFLQNQNYSLADIVKNIKGNSSHWINQSKFLRAKFSWQTGYGAFSVSESMINEVRVYIANQKEHHKKISFEEEYKRFADKYGLSIANR
jgi:putative transposase